MMDSVVMKYLCEFFAQHPWELVSYIVLSFATPLGEVVLPYYYGQIIQGIADKKPIKKYVIIVAVLWVLVQVMFGIMDKIDSYVVPEMQAFLRNKVVDEILKLSVHQNDDLQVSRIIDRLSKLPIIVTDLFVELRCYFLPALYVMVFAAGYFYFVNVSLGLITTLLIVIFFTIMYLFKSSFHNSEMSARQSELSEQIGDILENLNSVYANGTIDGEKVRIGEKHEDLKTATQGTYARANNLKLALNAFYAIAFLTINGYSYFLYKKGKIPLASLSSVFIIVLYMIGQFVTLSGEITSVIQNMSVVDEVHEFVENLKATYAKDKRNSDEAPPADAQLSGSVVLENVSYGIDGKLIFDGMNVAFPAGSKTCLFGKVGSGKTTLINLMMGYRVPDAGRILFDGRELNCREVRENVSYVKQNHRLFDRTLYDNIAYGSKIAKSDVQSLLEKYGLGQAFGTHALDDPIGKNGCHLSGGQRQIVALLRAVIRDRRIVIMDEPTSAMDEDMRNVVVKFVQSAFEGKTVIFITHDSYIRTNYGFDRVLDVSSLRAKPKVGFVSQ